MRNLACLGLAAGALAACATSPDDDYPVAPSTQPIPGVTSTAVTGRVCMVSDPRDMATCATTGAGGLTVAVGDQRAVTAADGSFTIPPAEGSHLAATVSGEDIVTSTMPFAPATAIPVLPMNVVDEMLRSNGITLAPGTGSILGTVVRAGTPVTGVTVTSIPVSAFGPFFDGTSVTSWTLDGTGARGVTWLPGIVAGPTALTFIDPVSSAETTVDGIQVVDGGITFVDTILP